MLRHTYSSTQKLIFLELTHDQNDPKKVKLEAISLSYLLFSSSQKEWIPLVDSPTLSRPQNPFETTLKYLHRH